MELLIQNVLDLGADEFYRTNRYDLPLTVILINSENATAFNVLYDTTRRTDIVQQLTSDLIVIFLTHTDIENSKLFIKKIESEFDFTYTMNEFTSSDSQVEFLQRLFLDNLSKSNDLSY